MTAPTHPEGSADPVEAARASTSTSASTTRGCPECDDLERGRRLAAAARDLSKVTDFDVLLARHRARHGADS
ncbi:hypothetical protein AB0G60_19615 [Streptomyces angustmyceticus]|uniref:hypothetical protein n=1 Tax=Streptomyces angustmyceticus TaxID=285578 RepID=UPI00117F6C69|nr:hypothetical protein [Streptomyces angustmyceticus]UAL71858.1 hypothetical protein K7396_14595 [Streptomyces angustmyceticus]